MREIAELTAKVNLLLAMNSVSDAELARRDEMLTQLRGQLAEKDDKIIELTKEVIDLRASTIWRLTAPIRSTTNFLRQLQSERRRN